MGEEGTNHHPPGLGDLVGRLARTSVGLLQNRTELLSVEWQIEKTRQIEVLVCTVGLLFLGLMGMMLITATIVLLFAEPLRPYVAAGFAVLYLAAAAVTWLRLKALLDKEPFSESRNQIKKDAAWLESLK